VPAIPPPVHLFFVDENGDPACELSEASWQQLAVVETVGSQLETEDERLGYSINVDGTPIFGDPASVRCATFRRIVAHLNFTRRSSPR
jgi:hypothetical protein